MKYTFFIFSLIIASITFAQGSGNTLNFDGAATGVSLGDQVATGVRTIEAWVKLDNAVDNTLANGYCIAGRSGSNPFTGTDQFHLGFETNAISPGNGGKISFSRRVGLNNFVIYSDLNTWPANTWIHVAAILDPVDGMKMYINGIEQADTDPTTDAIIAGATGDNATIGQWGIMNVRYFDGDIDEVRLWDDARTENEIRTNLCKKLLGNEPGLKAYYNFDNIAGTTLPDESTNTNDGTLLGFGATPSILSGAPLGDGSTFAYAASLAGTTLNYVVSAGDVFEVSNINSVSSLGVHIYRVNQLPNNLTNINNPAGNYYGVFLTGVDGTYDINYNIQDYGCSSCFALNERNDNASGPWTTLVGAPNSCAFQFANESSIGDTYRAEYILDQAPFVFDLGNDTSVCTSPLTIGESFAGATYMWQDGTTTTPFYDVTLSGTYWVEVDVQGCTGSDTINVQVVDLDFDLGVDTTLCGGNGTFGLSTGLSNNYNHLWQDGSTNNSFIVTSSGEYNVTVTDGNCVNQDTITVEIIDQPEINLGSTQIACEGEQVTLTNLSVSSIDTYTWSTGSNASNITVDQAGTYGVLVENECGIAADSVLILFENCDCNIYIPNSFTPDGDAANDGFKVEGDCKFMVYELNIFNRTGTLIFSSTDIADVWDGTYNGQLVPDGVYVYKIKYTTERVYSEYILGHINVLR
ncbi:LamG-like jellyroll fold domain-containing protein [Lishizhenia sp.]|uniref:LamG-like jellyroll fold domain-containing protein n=1 Tax=Lishizhenia sp. TaxID=2497594 RepID=UPI00299E8C88|nr:LamG-like jellyroll fold domain-containing protein [Lishizhenia sp.]MDX1445433.1 LamG-like jellyroll fold domain-containing protein [Lishizhenia sp.]